MKIKSILILFFGMTFLFIASQKTNAQYAYGISDIVYDNATKRVTTFSGTALDYVAGLHYDPVVTGGVFQEGILLGSPVRAYGFANIYSAVVRLRTTNASPLDTRYDVLSDHGILAYFYAGEPVLLPEEDYPIPRKQWYDPLGFSRYGGGADPGWTSYRGSSAMETYFDAQYFYLGTTGKGIIANPTTCSTSLAPCPTPTPTPSKVEIRNRFKGNEDLSAGSTYNGMVGAPVQLNAVILPEPDSQVTYKWTADVALGSNCGTASICVAEIKIPNPANKPYYTINLEVKIGDQTPIIKSVKLKISYPIVETFTGVERKPAVFFEQPGCPTTGSGSQFLGLGCGLISPSDGISKVGMSAKGTVAPPSDFISDGSSTFVELRQLVKTNQQRNSSKGCEKLVFVEPDTQGWREDYNGREEIIATRQNRFGLKVRQSFVNGSSGNNAKVILGQIDSPLTLLADGTINNAAINQYTRSDEFETYITYYTGLEDTDTDFGQQNRHALSVMPWKWNGKAQKKGAVWRLTGDYSPTGEISLTGQSPTAQTTSGERASNGTYRILGSEITNADFEEGTCQSSSTLNITTKKDVAVWRKTNGVWYVMDANGGLQQATQWGSDYDITVPADYDGDGRADFAVYRPDNPTTTQNECAGGCYWYILKSSDNSLVATQYGISGDKPVPADYDGDGRADLAVYRPSDTAWYVTKSSDGSLTGLLFGTSTDTPIPSDYDGDGIDDFAVWSASTATWSVRKSSDLSVVSQPLGYSTDIPVIGDYDGDGKTDFANWQTDGVWHILLSGSGQAKFVSFGNPATDTPIPGDYDGDDITDIAVWRPSATQTAEWFVLNSTNNQMQVYLFGSQGDVPVPAAYTH